MWSTFREWRHSPCLMTPLSAILLFIMAILSLVLLILQLPGVLIGFFITPIAKRGNWFVEFLYPFGLAKWGHLKLMQWGSATKNGVVIGGGGDDESSGMVLHSRCIEQRTEVVKGRVYIHPLPQLLDNIGYLIVCTPPHVSVSSPTHIAAAKKWRHTRRQDKERSRQVNQQPTTQSPIVGILVDCGDAEAAIEQITLIKDVHYNDIPGSIQIQSLLSTHKHHDHTAGNKTLLKHKIIGKTLKHIYGGAVERVPFCNSYVSNGSFVTLPSVGDNDMNSLVSIECIAAPSHTRGSIVYALRNKPRMEFGYDDEPSIFDQVGRDETYSYLFTGDTMFSAGSGVPFEADIEFPKDKEMESKKSSSPFKPSAGYLSIERCFAEILRRGVHDQDILPSHDGQNHGAQQILIFPGHEYTLDLLQRQFTADAMAVSNSTWNRHNPSVFFELASQFFIAGHRRHLPKSTRLLSVPSSMKRELKINPNYRSLKKRGEHILTAISIWYKHGKHHNNITTNNDSESKYLTLPMSYSNDELYQVNTSLKSPSSEVSWNINHEDVNRPIFSTVYSTDLQEIILGLKTGTLDSSVAAHKLSKMSDKLDEPIVHRRPIPNTFPSEKKMYLGLLALAVLGSEPSALKREDSERMNLPHPVEASDYLMISKSKLISSLFRLGLLSNCTNYNEFKDNDLVQMIDVLWDEAKINFEDLQLYHEKETNDVEKKQMNDLIELGALKLTLYAVPYNQPSWFSKFCMPCCDTKMSTRYKRSERKANVMKVKKRSGGELVRHDIAKCRLCSDVLGCPNHVEDEKNSKMLVHIMNNVSPLKSPSSKGGSVSPNRRSGEGIELRATTSFRPQTR